MTIVTEAPGVHGKGIAERNMHLLHWGTTDYQNPSWGNADGIHPTPAGQVALAVLETQELRRVC